VVWRVEKKLLDDTDIYPIISEFASKNIRKILHVNMSKLFYVRTTLYDLKCYLEHIYIFKNVYNYCCDVYIKGLKFCSRPGPPKSQDRP
jgi:hypothetical protein